MSDSADTALPARPDLRNRPRQERAPRAELRDPDGLDALRRALYDSIVGGPRSTQLGRVPLTDGRGRLLGPFGLMLIAPEVGDCVQRLGSAIRFSSGLTDRQRELAVLCVAVETASGFEWWAHELAGVAAGLSVQQLQDLLDGTQPGALDEAEDVVVRVARALIRNRGLEDPEFARARAALGEERLAELVWLVGYYSMLATALEVFAPANPLQPAPETTVAI